MSAPKQAFPVPIQVHLDDDRYVHGGIEYEPGMTLREYYAGQMAAGLIGDNIVQSSIAALAKATGRDSAWRKEMIDAVAQSAAEMADALIAELEKPCPTPPK